MPLDSIEQYYGEKVAFYFAWLQHSTIKLIFPSAMGIVVTLWQVLTNSWHDNYILPLYSVSLEPDLYHFNERLAILIRHFA
jgi:hypothetical protein